jgi:glycosyltransferase involved in cell wall biosynthesis
VKTVTLSSNTSWYLYNFRASTIRRFIEEGYRVVCLSPPDDYGHRLEGDLGAEWLSLPMDNAGSNPFRDFGLILRFWRHYHRLKPTAALHFTIKNNVYGTWAARLNGVPSINNVSGLGTAFIRSGFVGTVVRILYRTSMPLASRVFCQNEEDYDLLVREKLVPADRLSLLPGSGVDLQRFKPDLRERHDSNFRFLYAGRMLADKGLRELIEAVQLLHTEGLGCEIWLCGFPDVKNVSAITQGEIEEWDRLPFVRYLGPSDAMETIYAQVDCVVLPSYREGMPKGILEAGAMGLPVVVTDVPGCRNVVTDAYNGLLCQARDVKSLADAMRRMLEMSDDARDMLGRNGRERVQAQFDEQLVINAALEAVNSVLNSRQ